MPAISVSNLSYGYPGSSVCAFEDVSFELERGEMIRIEGRNGSGKTSLLKVLSKFMKPTSGAISAAGKVLLLNQDSVESMAPNLTIREHFKALAKQSNAATKPVKLLAGFDLGLDSRMDEFVGHLSGGQRQIVALVCGLMAAPTVLCLDEFTAAMDSQSVEMAEKAIRTEVESRSLALVVVSHRDFGIIGYRELVLQRGTENGS